jgi:hypothetical protein
MFHLRIHDVGYRARISRQQCASVAAIACAGRRENERLCVASAANRAEYLQGFGRELALRGLAPYPESDPHEPMFRIDIRDLKLLERQRARRASGRQHLTRNHRPRLPLRPIVCENHFLPLSLNRIER